MFSEAVKYTSRSRFVYTQVTKTGVSRGVQPLGSGFPIGASSIPVGTRLPLESLVCYTFVEQMAAGIVARPGTCGYSCGVLAGKVATCGQHKRQKKAGKRGGYALSASRVICETKV